MNFIFFYFFESTVAKNQKTVIAIEQNITICEYEYSDKKRREWQHEGMEANIFTFHKTNNYLKLINKYVLHKTMI